MKLLIIFGPQAVGKMTVGQELEKITGLKLFHNHMTIELVSHFFSYGTKEGKELVKAIRKEIFETVSKSELEGLIFTYMWALESQKDWDYIEEIKNIFLKENAEIYFLELESTIEERIKRNKTENRLNNKPTKRDLEWSENELIKSNNKHRLNSKEGEIKEKNYLKIDNTNKSAEEVAKIVKEKFNL